MSVKSLRRCKLFQLLQQPCQVRMCQNAGVLTVHHHWCSGFFCSSRTTQLFWGVTRVCGGKELMKGQGRSPVPPVHQPLCQFSCIWVGNQRKAIIWCKVHSSSKPHHQNRSQALHSLLTAGGLSHCHLMKYRKRNYPFSPCFYFQRIWLTFK